MKKLLLIPLLSWVACNGQPQLEKEATQAKSLTLTPLTGYTIATRFESPNGYKRVTTQPGSFASYLQNLPLKPPGTQVKLYDGSNKRNQEAHAAVVDLPIGTKDLHQCADAIIRLRAEFLYEHHHYNRIQFHFTNGFLAQYAKWKNGKRIQVEGHQVGWDNRSQPDSSYNTFRNYLEQVFMYAGTLSLEREMEKEEWDDISIGDVLIQGGSPGHAVIVVDMASNNNGEKLIMLAQSYMPAQELHILRNPNNNTLSPWYSTDIRGKLVTPEWTFNKTDLKRF